MGGETELDKLLASLTAKLAPETYVFATHLGPVPSGVTPCMVFAEEEGTTLIVPLAQARALGLAFEYESRMITLDIHSSLEAVGFLAVITARLAAAGLSVNPVSAFYHDHLFVPVDRADEAMAILKTIAAEAAAP